MPRLEAVTPYGSNEDDVAQRPSEADEALDVSAPPTFDLGHVSPELALIDPELAAAARARLPQPVTPAVLRPLVQADEPERVERQAAKTTQDAAAAAAPGATTHRGWRLLSAGLLALATVTVAVVTLVDWEDRSVPRSLEPTDSRPSSTATAPAATAPPSATTTPAATTPQPTSTPPAADEGVAQTFVWAPAPGAAAYEVQLFSNEVRVLRTRVAEPRLELPRTWRHAGREQSLQPGTYRWYVWPVSRTRQRARVATVQARLVVGG